MIIILFWYFPEYIKYLVFDELKITIINNINKDSFQMKIIENESEKFGKFKQ